jgi:hypothetical protein
VKNFTCIFIVLLLTGIFSGCGPSEVQKPEFTEIRIRRWTALEGGEIIVIRRLGDEWSATLLGDGDRFSCLYQKKVTPKSNWSSVWNALLAKGLLDLHSLSRNSYIEDGDGFNVEIFYNGELKRFSIPQPRNQGTEDSRKILAVGNLIADEFDTPVFVADYDRGKVGEYIMDTCKALETSN